MTLNIFIPFPDFSFPKPLRKSLSTFFSEDISIKRVIKGVFWGLVILASLVAGMIIIQLVILDIFPPPPMY